MNTPYLIISDLHVHKWSAFATVEEDGQNSRLTALLSEIDRAAATLAKAGGKKIVVAGDLFHVRGNLSPSVLNPTMDRFRLLIEQGFEVTIIPGNHDLEGRDSARLGSAVTALEGLGCKVVHEPLVIEGMVLVPWIESITELKEELERLKNGLYDSSCGGDTDIQHKFDLIIHAPVNGVIMGIPDHGLEPEWLAKLGFKRVFAGHYHNHMDFPGQVYSIGALAHHTWSDVGSQAGFLIVHERQVDFHPSTLPKFVDVTPDMKADNVSAAVKGNYARVKVSTSKIAEIEKMREWLTKEGALGTVIMSVKKPVEERTGAIAVSVGAGASIEQSISDFVKSKGFEADLIKDIEMAALRVLAEAEVA